MNVGIYCLNIDDFFLANTYKKHYFVKKLCSIIFIALANFIVP